MNRNVEPGEAHAALMAELHGVAGRFGGNGMPGLERIAVLAQFIGQEVAALPENSPYTAQELLASIAANIEAGNRVAMGKTQTSASGLVGLN